MGINFAITFSETVYKTENYHWRPGAYVLWMKKKEKKNQSPPGKKNEQKKNNSNVFNEQ